MRTPPEAARSPELDTPGLDEKDDRSGKTIDETSKSLIVTRQPAPWHADHPQRRIKSKAELVDAHETNELHDRTSPGLLATRPDIRRRPSITLIEHFDIAGVFVGIKMRRLDGGAR